MAAILEIPEVRERISRLSVEEYHRLDEFNENNRRTELIRGLVIEKVSKSPLHRVIGTLLYELLHRQVPRGYTLWTEQPLTLADSEPEPDISVTSGKVKDFLDGHPTTAELVVEVAVSSAALDIELASVYAEAEVKEYWIIFCRERRIEVFRRPLSGRYTDRRSVGIEETVECGSLPGVKIRLRDLFEAE